MEIFLAIILTLLFVGIGFNIYFTIKALGILVQIIDFINMFAKNVSVKHMDAEGLKNDMFQ